MEEKINILLEDVKKNIPFYRKNLVSNTLQLSDFPIVNKSTLKDNFYDLINSTYKEEELLSEYTSGSTGMPFKCIKSKAEMLVSQKKIWKWREKNCNNIFNKTLLAFSNDITNISEVRCGKEKVNSNYYGNLNYKIITPKDIQELSTREILSYIQGINASWIRGTPSNLYYFSKKLEKELQDTEMPVIDFVEVSGEVLDDYQRTVIAKTFNCKVKNHYGCREVWPIACECEKGNLHILEDHVFCETVNQNKYSEGKGELCITALNQYSFPFIRYNIGDVVELENIECECGKKGTVIKTIGGRKGEWFSIDQKYYSVQIFSQLIKKLVKRKLINPYFFRIIQKSSYHFILLLQQESDNLEEVSEYVRKYFQKNVSEKMYVETRFCSEIPLRLREKNNYFFVTIQHPI